MTEIAQANPLLRSEVTGYGIESEYFSTVLDGFLDRQRPGEILIELGLGLREITEAPDGDYRAQVANLLDKPTAMVNKIIAAGGTVQLCINCSTPRWMATHPLEHSVLSGQDEPNGEPLWACSAPTRPDAWRRIMQAVAEHFADHADHIRFTLGNEPENYFAGDLQELLAWYEASVRGILDATNGDRFAVGGLTMVGHLTSRLDKAYPELESDNSVSFAPQELSEPVTRLWIGHCAAAGLPLHRVSLHLFGASPVPKQTAYWNATHADIAVWLEADGYDSTQVEIVINDFPHWAPYESNDTEYMAAHTVSSIIAMLEHSLNSGGSVRLLQGFLMAWGFRPDGPSVAGFTGVPALVNEAGITKAVFSANQLLSKVEGELVRVDSDDPFINAIAAVGEDSLSVLVALHVPLEYQVDLKYDYWVDTPLLSNHFGGVVLSDTGIDGSQLLKDLTDTYFHGETPTPLELLDALFDEESRIDCGALGWPEDVVLWCSEMQAFGQRARKKRNSITKVEFGLGDFVNGDVRVQEYVVDAEHANAYADREAIHERLEAARERGELLAEIEAVNAMYDAESGLIRDEVKDSNGPFVLSMQPNSVHLLIFTATTP